MKNFVVIDSSGTFRSFDTGAETKEFAEDDAAQNPGKPIYVYRHLLTVTNPLDNGNQLPDTDDHTQET